MVAKSMEIKRKSKQKRKKSGLSIYIVSYNEANEKLLEKAFGNILRRHLPINDLVNFQSNYVNR